MNILSYSPKVEAYVAIGEGGGNVVDLTPDIVLATVSRVSDGASSFTIKLQNELKKYNGLFTQMDRVKIYVTKVERTALITGYITKAPSYSLYGGDVTIEGQCSLYRLQQLYWDPCLMESQRLLGYEANEREWDSVLRNLLTKVGGVPESSISIGDISPAMITWARQLYEAHQEDQSQLKDMVDEFYNILQTHGPTASTSGMAAAAGAAGSSGGTAKLTGDEKKASQAQKEIVEVATSGSVPGSGGMCLQWVNDVYQVAGYPFTRYPGAIDVWRNRESASAYSSDMSKIPLAAAVVTTGSGSGGNGHIGIYIGGGEVISEVGGQRVETVEGFGSWSSFDTIDGMTGMCGFVCPSTDPAIDWK